MRSLTLTAADAAAADAVLNGEAGGEPMRRARVESWLKVLEASPMPGAGGDLAGADAGAVAAERMRVAGGGDGRGMRDRPTRASAPLADRRAWGIDLWRRRLAESGQMAWRPMLLLR